MSILLQRHNKKRTGDKPVRSTAPLQCLLRLYEAAPPNEDLSLDGIENSIPELTLKLCHNDAILSRYRQELVNDSASNIQKRLGINAIIAVCFLSGGAPSKADFIKPRITNRIYYVSFHLAFRRKPNFNKLRGQCYFNVISLYHFRGCRAQRNNNAKAYAFTGFLGNNDNRSPFYHFRCNEAFIVTNDYLSGFGWKLYSHYVNAHFCLHIAHKDKIVNLDVANRKENQSLSLIISVFVRSYFLMKRGKAFRSLSTMQICLKSPIPPHSKIFRRHL